MKNVSASPSANPSNPITLSRSEGVTLIELLVTLSVMSVLMGMLIPQLQKARGVTHKVACQQNLRQWGLATQLYVLDHDGFLPHDGAPNGISRRRAWYVELPLQIGDRPYLEQPNWRTDPEAVLPRSLWLCPGNTRRSNGHGLFHYCLNRHINGSGAASRRVQLSSLSEPARLVWLYDNGGLAAVASIRNVHTNLHQQGANILFLDGHVERLKNTEYWDYSSRHPIWETPKTQWTPSN
jgi:prepilin-type processing-associated H-X9-DG protein/prepilin-type N-terminal cleavage/methylation domain-containing protein